MSDKSKLIALLNRRFPGEVSKPAIVKALGSYSVTQRISEARRFLRAQGRDIACREWTRKRDRRRCSAYKITEAI
jgi:hypothetical protein